MFGFGTNTYNNDVDWNASKGKELQQFKAKVSPEKFKEANELYNTKVNEKVVKLLEDDRYKKLSDDDKLKTLTKLKNSVKAETYKKYNFVYKAEKAKGNPVVDTLAK